MVQRMRRRPDRAGLVQHLPDQETHMKLRLLWLGLGILIGLGLALLIVAWILTAQLPVDSLPGGLMQLWA